LAVSWRKFSGEVVAMFSGEVVAMVECFNFLANVLALQLYYTAASYPFWLSLSVAVSPKSPMQ
jgi:hypothetical protein